VHAAEGRAPCRADLAGGTLDIWPLGILHPGSVTVNAALAEEVLVRVDDGADAGEVWHATHDAVWRPLRLEDRSDLTVAVVGWLRPEGGVRVRVERQPPVGSGLGGSSSYAVALAAALLELAGATIPDKDMVAVVRDLEARVLQAPTGVQDQWAAVRGGVLALHLEPGAPRLEPLDVSPRWLDERLTVVYTGVRHSSGMVNWQVIRRRLEGESETVAALDAIAAAARACRAALLEGDETAVGDAIAAEWAARRRLAPEVCPPELDRLTEIAVRTGARAVKACGAGGGGSMLVWHPPERRPAIEAALLAAAPAGRVIARGVATRGVSARRTD